MRNKKQNIPRLLLLATYLKDEEFNRAHMRVELAYSKEKVHLMFGMDGKCYNFFPFVIKALPALFKEWQLNERGQITYLPDPKIVNNYAVLEYFGLEMWPMLHLFTIGYQNTAKYGGFILSKNTQPKNVAENIYRYIESLPHSTADKNMVFTRRVLIEKIDLHHMFSYKKTKRN